MEDKIDILENEKRLLIADLTAPNSEVGDWKVIKNIEFYLCGLDMPYDANTLHEERVLIRKRINEIEKEIIELKQKDSTML